MKEAKETTQTQRSETMTEGEKIYLANSSLVELDTEKKLAIYRNSGGRIEKLQETSIDEKILLQSVKNGYVLYYTLYTYRIQNEADLKEFEHALLNLYEEHPLFKSIYVEVGTREFVRVVGRKRKSAFSVYDISERSERDKKLIVQNFLLKERKNKYNPFKQCALNVNVFKIQENDYVCVLALCEQGESAKYRERVLTTLFHSEEYVRMENSLREENIPVLACSNYWKSMLRNIPAQQEPEMKYLNNGIESELFILDDELAQLLASFSKESGIGLKELFLTIWGVILNKFNNSEEMVIGDADEDGILTVAPIRIRQTFDINRLLFDIKEQLESKKKYVGYSLEELKNKQHLDLMKGVYVIQNFNDTAENKLITANMQENCLYRVKPYSIPEVPLQVEYNITSLIMRMRYTYNRRIYDNTDIAKFHEVFQKLAKGMLEIIKEKYEGSIDEVAEQAMKIDASKLIMSKTGYLRKSKIFNSYDLEDLMMLTQKCRTSDYQMGEVILDEQIQTDTLYIVASGRVEVSRTNLDSYLVPVQIFKEGSIFGIECITKDAFSENKYVAYSDNVKILEIPKAVLKNEIDVHPSILFDLVDYQCRQINKFQTLWIMG